jgi:hypothetical protein
MKFHEFLRELHRRSVWKVAVAYTAAAAVLFEVLTLLFHNFEAPHWVLKVITKTLIAGLPMACLVAWGFTVKEGRVRYQKNVGHGIDEDLLNALAGIDQLKVAARTSLFVPAARGASSQEVGETLHVRRRPPACEQPCSLDADAPPGALRPPYLSRTFAALAVDVCAHARGRGWSAC